MATPAIDSIAALLDRAAEIIAPPGAWTQGALARDVDGISILDAQSPEAVCFCAAGAIEAVGAPQSLESAALGFLYDRWGLVAAWNDFPGRTQQQVVDRLRTTADFARKLGK